MFNLRHRITRLKLEGEELAKYGPAKHPEQQGIDKYSDQAVEQGQFYTMDPTGRRTGNGKTFQMRLIFCIRINQMWMLDLGHIIAPATMLTVACLCSM